MSIRKADVIKYLPESPSSWYLDEEILIIDAQAHYLPGNLVTSNNQKYKVVEDYGVLRVTPVKSYQPPL